MFPAHLEGITIAVGDDQNRSRLWKIEGAFQKINAGLEDRAATTSHLHPACNLIGPHIAGVVRECVAEYNARSRNFTRLAIAGDCPQAISEQQSVHRSRSIQNNSEGASLYRGRRHVSRSRDVRCAALPPAWPRIRSYFFEWRKAVVKPAGEVHNPFSPFANRVFPNPYVHISFEEGYRARLAHWNGVSRREIPLEATVKGGPLQGIVGPVFLLAPIALLALGDPVGRQVLLAFLCFLLPYPGNIGTRFLIPALPFLALAICIPLSRWRIALAAVLVFHFLASQPYFLRRYSQAATIERHWNETLRTSPEDETLRERVDGYAMAQYINRNLPASARLYQIGGFPLAYTERLVDGYYESALSERLYFVFFSGVDQFPEWAPTWHTTFHFDAGRWKRIRIETATGKSGPSWAVSEVLFFDHGREIRPSPSWRLHSSQFCWDAGFAFDGNLATSWRAWEQPHPGMYLEAAFGEPMEIDELRVDAPLEQRTVSLLIEGEGANGNLWKIPAISQSGNSPLPAGYRALIGKEFKASGYTHLIMKKGIPGYEELRRNPAEWGLRFVAEQDGYVLCQFQ